MKFKAAMYAMKAVGLMERLLFASRFQVSQDSPAGLRDEGYALGDDRFVDQLRRAVDVEAEIPKGDIYVRNILSGPSIASVARETLTNDEIRSTLQTVFPGKFSVDFITYYRTLPLPEAFKGKSVYANHWHTDTTLTKYCVKILILFDPIDDESGPLKVYSKRQTRLMAQGGFVRGGEVPAALAAGPAPAIFDGRRSRIIFVRPHECLHAAGVPEAGKYRNQMMIQLNPARRWQYRADLHQAQHIKEPTLALIKNVFRKSVAVTA